ncbi:MAG: zinc ribbon domain-containing protein [Lachnospiraceae bacterium]|nr:zinc ribbon domain-containing protein [Lachnospiraceae bacterium]
MYVIPVGLIAWILRKCGEWICIVLGIIAIIGGGGIGGVVFLAIGIVWLVIKQRIKKKIADSQTPQPPKMIVNTNNVNTNNVNTSNVNTSNVNIPSVQSAAFCPNCGTKAVNGSLFCGTCGTKLN